MRRLGNKVTARELATAAGVPVMPATPPLPRDDAQVRELAAEVGYPVMLKASWGGGGRGMRVDRRRGATGRDGRRRRGARRKAAFGNDEVYLEKLVRRARHVEVQILGDKHGNLVHLYERDCTVQRRNQKVVERAPAVFLDDAQRQRLCELGLRIGRAVGYLNAGTVEFLQDADTGQFYFIEVNPRIQVEHTVTEVVTGIDLVKAQIRIAEGADDRRRPPAACPRRRTSASTATRCSAASRPRIRRTTSSRTTAASRRIAARRASASGSTPARPTRARSSRRSYDSLLVKVTAWAPTSDETIARMDRALREFRVRGVSTNLRFLEQVITHEHFRDGAYTTRFIDQTPELFRYPRKRDRATRLLRFVGDVIVNGNPEVTGRARPAPHRRCAAAEAARQHAAARHEAAARRAGRRRSSRSGCSSSRRCCSPTRRCATRTSRCSRRACAPATWSRSRRPTRASRRTCSRSNAGAARRSTSRCASCANARGSA